MSLRWEEKDALVECYGEFHAGLLFEIVLLFDRLERRELSSYEATKLALARFATLMQEHLPQCRKSVEAYQERVTAERRKLTTAAAAYEEKRQAAVAGEKLRLEKEAADRNTEIYNNAVAAEQREREQWKQKYDEMERVRREKNDKDSLSAEAAAKKGAALLDAIEKG